MSKPAKFIGLYDGYHGCQHCCEPTWFRAYLDAIFDICQSWTDRMRRLKELIVGTRYERLNTQEHVTSSRGGYLHCDMNKTLDFSCPGFPLPPFPRPSVFCTNGIKYPNRKIEVVRDCYWTFGCWHIDPSRVSCFKGRAPTSGLVEGYRRSAIQCRYFLSQPIQNPWKTIGSLSPDLPSLFVGVSKPYA